MPSIHNEKYADIAARLNDWLAQYGTGSAVANLALDLINRAKNNLWMERDWDGLVKIAPLTVINQVASLPVDFGREIAIYHDSNGDNKPDLFYYRDSRTNYGYRLNTVYTAAAGTVITLTFYVTPAYTPQIVYVQTIPDFTGTGTEYIFFPGELLIIRAQLIRLGEEGMSGPDYEAISERDKSLFKKYVAENQYRNSAFQREVKDSRGQILNEMIELNLDGTSYQNIDTNSRSYDRGARL